MVVKGQVPRHRRASYGDCLLKVAKEALDSLQAPVVLDGRPSMICHSTSISSPSEPSRMKGDITETPQEQAEWGAPPPGNRREAHSENARSRPNDPCCHDAQQ
jgi:hypothetical protein